MSEVLEVSENCFFFQARRFILFFSLSLSLSIILNVITQHYNKQIAIAARGIRRDVNNISSDRD